MSDWLSVRDAARVAGVHPNTVRNWLRDGRVRSELSDGLHGPTYRIPLEDVVGPGGSNEAFPRRADPVASSAIGTRLLLLRLAEVEDARLEEAKARSAAEARLEQLDDLRRQLEDARAEVRTLRDALAKSVRPRKGA